MDYSLFLQSILLSYLKTDNIIYVSFIMGAITYLWNNKNLFKDFFKNIFRSKKAYIIIDDRGLHNNGTNNGLYYDFLWYTTNIEKPTKNLFIYKGGGDSLFTYKNVDLEINYLKNKFDNFQYYIQEIKKETGVQEKMDLINRITLTGTHKTNEKLLEFLKYIVDERKKIRWLQSISYFNVVSDQINRSEYYTNNQKKFNSVILNKKDKDSLLFDFNQFFESEEYYKECGINWSRGYLFYGKPGCGKTSLIKAMSFEKQLDLYIVKLNEIETDKQLRSIMGMIPSKSMIVFEDIDCMSKIVHKRDENLPELEDTSDETSVSEKSEDGFLKVKLKKKKPDGVTLSELLNQLDGIVCHEGRIVVMTTNHIEKIDPALIRPGRIDFKLELLPLGKESIIDCFKLIIQRDMNLYEKELLPDSISLSGAVVSGLFLKYRNDPKLAIEELVKIS